MLAFFTRAKEYEVLERNVDAIDIITKNFKIHIRISGILIIPNEQFKGGIETEVTPLHDLKLDLT